VYDGLVDSGRIVRVDATGSVAEVQTRVRKLIQHAIDLSTVEPIDENDRLAETIRTSTFDWVAFEGGQA